MNKTLYERIEDLCTRYGYLTESIQDLFRQELQAVLDEIKKQSPKYEIWDQSVSMDYISIRDLERIIEDRMK